MAIDLSTTARLMEAIKGIAGEASRSTRTVPAVCTRVDGDGTAWVRAVGSSEDTPIDGASTSVVEAGDMVNVDVNDGTATIVGNMSSPSVGSVQLQRVTESVRRMGSSLMESIDTAGGIAGAAERVAKAINQHFWADDSGIHVTQATQEDWQASSSGPNVLINSLGQLFRDGANNLLTMTTESGARALAIWDGAGNAAANVIAEFGSSVRIGKTSGDHMTLDSTNGVTLFKAGLKRLMTTAGGVDVYGSDGSTSVASFGASARVGKSNGDRVVVDSTNGVTVYKANSKRLQTSANGMEVYGSDGSTSIASFGSSARVGSASSNNVLINTSGLTVRSGTTVWSRVMQGSKTWWDHEKRVAKTSTVTGLDILGGFSSGGASLFASPQTNGVSAHLYAGGPSSADSAGIDIASVRRWSSDASSYDVAAVETEVSSGGTSPLARILASSGDRENVFVMAEGTSERPVTLACDNLYVKSWANGDGVLTTTRAFPCHGMVGQNTTVSAGGYADVNVRFNHTYTSAPTVVVGLYSTSTSSDLGRCSVAVMSTSTTSFTARLFNNSGSDRAPGFYWIAVG